jgi:hypothetical protein
VSRRADICPHRCATIRPCLKRLANHNLNPRIFKKPTADKEKNWIQPLYGLLEPWFAKSWRPSEIELIP